MTNILRAIEHIESKFAQLTRELPAEIGKKLSIQTKLTRTFDANGSSTMYVRVHFGTNSYEASSPSFENAALLLAQLSAAGKVLNEYIEVAQFFDDAQKETGHVVEFARVVEGVHLETKFGDKTVRTRPTIEQSDEWNKFAAMVQLYPLLTKPN